MNVLRHSFASVSLLGLTSLLIGQEPVEPASRPNTGEMTSLRQAVGLAPLATGSARSPSTRRQTSRPTVSLDHRLLSSSMPPSRK